MFLFLAELELLMTRAGDLVEFRIDAVLKEMAKTTLCELPEDDPWTVEQFLDRTQVRVTSHMFRYSHRIYSDVTGICVF